MGVHLLITKSLKSPHFGAAKWPPFRFGPSTPTWFILLSPYHRPPDWLRLQLCFAWLKMAHRSQLAF